MKKMLIVLIGILMIAGVSFAQTTSSGEIAARIAATQTLTGATYPTNSTTGTPQLIVAGADIANIIVVDGITINDNSISGWDLQVDSTNGGVLEAANTATIPYTLDMAVTGGTLGTGLGITALSPLVLNGGVGSEAIQATGTATTATVNYEFDIEMSILGADIGAALLAGIYSDTIDLTLTSND